MIFHGFENVCGFKKKFTGSKEMLIFFLPNKKFKEEKKIRKKGINKTWKEKVRIKTKRKRKGKNREEKQNWKRNQRRNRKKLTAGVITGPAH